MHETPIITEMTVVPVAGYDSMLLNIAGAHNCHFTRNIVILKDSAGHTGAGEAPGSAAIARILEAARPFIVGQSIGRMKALVSALHERDLVWERSARARGEDLGAWNLERHHNALAALEAACLDLMGQFLGVPVAELLGPGKQRDEVPVLGYLFYIADRTKTNMGYLPGRNDGHAWYHLRHQAAMDIAGVIRLAEAAQDLYGFKDFKLKGGVHPGRYEVDTVLALLEHFPGARVTVDPNASWRVADAIELCQDLRGRVPYVEDPCGAEGGFSGRETLAEFKRATGLPVATNMIANDWRQMGHAHTLNSIDIPLADPHFWTMTGAITVGQLCQEWHWTMGCHSNNHFDISLAMVAQLGAAAPGNITPFDTHWLWQDGQRLTRDPLLIRNGVLRVPDRPGLGIELDMGKIEEAHALFRSLPTAERNDAIGMQFLIKDWRFDPKRATLVR